MNNAKLRNAVIAASLLPVSMVSVPATAEQLALEEIVVSAQRREQSLQEVPISITAFSSSDVETLRIDNILDIGLMVPNLSAVEGSGGTQAIKYQIRGLEANGTALGADSGVATYLDGVYLKGGSAAIVSYADIERIEVLRGPQGTLFGRNTSGGAIHFITRNPSGEFGFRQQLTTGNYGHFRSRTRIDMPQMGPLRALFNYTHSEIEGPVENLAAGATYDLTPFGGGIETSPKRLGDEEVHAFSAAIQLDLIDDLDITYKYDYSEREMTPSAVGIIGVQPGVYQDFMWQPSYSLGRPDKVNNPVHLPSYLDAEGHNLTLEYALSDTITLKNILSYREGSVEVPGQTLDGMGLYLPFLGQPLQQTAALAFVVSAGVEKEETQEEFQVIWDTDNFTLTTGFLYYGLESTAGGYKRMQNGIFGGNLFPGFVPANQSEVESDSTALYSQLEYRFTDQFELVVGGRLTKDKKDYVDRTLEGVGYGIIYSNYDESETTWLLGANYYMTDDLMLFAKVSTGYISGGLVSSVAYDSEEAESYEAGFKGTFMDGRLQANLSAFFVEYTGQQFGTAGLLVDPPVPASQVLVNAGDSEASGFEFEGKWLPMDDLQLSLNLGYLDFDFTSVNFALLGGPIAPHLRPNWTGSLMADYETAPLIGNSGLQFHVDASFRSSEWMATRPTSYADGTNGSLVRFNAQVSMGGIELAGGKVSLALWGRNLTDVDEPNNMPTLGVVVAGTYYEPRTYGVDLTYEF